MSRIYEGDDLLITLDLGEDLTAATSPEILYRKPSGVTGEWTATISGTNLIYAAVADEHGVWRVQGRVTLDGGQRTSEIVVIEIEKPLVA